MLLKYLNTTQRTHQNNLQGLGGHTQIHLLQCIVLLKGRARAQQIISSLQSSCFILNQYPFPFFPYLPVMYNNHCLISIRSPSATKLKWEVTLDFHCFNNSVRLVLGFENVKVKVCIFSTTNCKWFKVGLQTIYCASY